MLIAGIFLGQLFKLLHFPSVTGQIIAGILLGHSGFNLIDVESLDKNLKPITEFALCLIAVTVGNHLNIKKLRNAVGRIVVIVLLEATLIPLFVISTLTMLGMDLHLAIIIAFVGIETAPATVISIIKDTKSRGTFVKTLIAVVALNNVICIFSFETVVVLFRGGILGNSASAMSLTELILQPTYQLFGAVLLGCVVGYGLILFTKHTFSRSRQFTASLGAILLLSGLAVAFNLSSLLSALFMGVFLTNVTPYKEEILKVFDDLEESIFALFFVIAGTHLDFTILKQVGWMCAGYVIARASAKFLAIKVASNFIHVTDKVKNWLGLSLIPQAGVSIGLVISLETVPEMKAYVATITSVVLAVVSINEIIGPLLLRLSLFKSGEINKDRQRLIDFLHEEFIRVDISADNKDELLERMCQFFSQTNQVKDISSDEMLSKYRIREEQMSTCVGQGVMIPHIIVPPDNDRISGIIGICQKGIPIDTPDGIPIHLILMIATPEGQHDMHLEALAALSRIFGNDDFIKSQIFHAKSPAQVIEILHNAEDYEAFNYFLEDN